MRCGCYLQPRVSQLKALLEEIAVLPGISIDDLRLKPEHVIREKWDWALPDPLRLASFASSTLDLTGAHSVAQTLAEAVQSCGR
jgi:ATP-dependent Lhr-like helicase